MRPMPDLSERSRLDELQRLLLPAELPTIGCTEAAAAYRASNHRLELGGDWFDLIDRPESNSVVAIVGDVVGHGVRQIGVMGQLRAAGSALANVLERPAAILAGLDRFALSVPGAAHATVIVLVLDGSNRALVASAGHVPPIRIDRDGTPHVIEDGRSAPLAVGARSVDGALEVHTDDLLILYTDGVVERPGSHIDEGIDGLASFAAARHDWSCIDLANAIVDEFGAGAIDDQAVMVLRPIHDRSEGYRLENRTPAQVSIGEV